MPIFHAGRQHDSTPQLWFRFHPVPNRAVRFPGQVRARRVPDGHPGKRGLLKSLTLGLDRPRCAKMNQPRTGHRKPLLRRCGIRLPDGVSRVEDPRVDLIRAHDENVCARFPG